MELDEYIKLNYPSIVNEYDRYLNRDNLPNVGETVVTLRRGFGGYGGQILTVVEVDEEYITLTDGDSEYISTISSWYKDIILIGE